MERMDGKDLGRVKGRNGRQSQRERCHLRSERHDWRADSNR